tara:strand:+ start:611 stop:868 length:258 start_codon:yes stop_codon:yes gene_type:complete
MLNDGDGSRFNVGGSVVGREPFARGDLIKRKSINLHVDDIKARSLCVVISEDIDNYTLYNLSTKKLQTIVKCVIIKLYDRYSQDV